MKSVYVNHTARYLPGPPIDNNQIEAHLGLIHGKPSRLKKRILKSNGILTRHYAMDTEHNPIDSNASMAAKSAQLCLDRSGLPKQQVSLLSAATTQGDQLLPGFASLVQAELGLPDIEINTNHGICSCSMMAMKYAYQSIALGEHKNALISVSEFASRLFKNTRYEAADAEAVDFNAEFLRWMLSDGAGAALLSSEPSGQKSLRIDWIKSFSYAHVYPTCMSCGTPAQNLQDKCWQDFPNCAAAEAEGAFLLRQDTRLLDNIVKSGVDGALKLIKAGYFSPDKVDHLLCHYSSHYFKSKIFDMLTAANAAIPYERWYSNLYTRGNTGAASILIMLDEFLETQDLQPGETIICMVPESGRFNVAYMHLTVV